MDFSPAFTWLFFFAAVGFGLALILILAAAGALVALPAAIWYHQWSILIIPAITGAGVGLVLFLLIVIFRLI